ncbi:MBOAT family protein [Candidatus Peregrinibacteria bacterium CG_4_9_14_0_2_um_filter_53_11]|nr:MAG: MBOAT family protein [Candidatus Peregrinibacteria bacterium CG_4_9_14_0_2_um_filter_53_11]
MIFSSLLFIFGFLPIFLALYFLTPDRWKNYTALLGSYLFYAWGAPGFIFVLILSSAFDFLLGRSIQSSKKSGAKNRSKQLLIIGLISNAGLLAYAKYANFFVDQLSTLLSVAGLDAPHWTAIALPLGISFFTFQKISYLVDIYRGTTAPARTFANYALYVALFPQLIAGPIVRYHDIAEQIRERTHTVDKFLYGSFRFAVGLGKKVLIANGVGQIADSLFALDPHTLPSAYLWLGAVAYGFQIYFDFAGYSDMAIGLGYMMGFRIAENFNMPYIAKSFTEFWRRWHISLSAWMKEYLYIPLGGNQISTKRTYFNLWIVFLFSGLWHGAAWNFVVWGAFHGLFLMLDKIFWLKKVEKLPPVLTRLLTFLLVTTGWVFFRAENLSTALTTIKRMFIWQTTSLPLVLWADLVSNRGLVILLVAAAISFIPSLSIVRKFIDEVKWPEHAGVKYIITLVLFSLSILSLVNASFNPFIYFRF